MPDPNVILKPEITYPARDHFLDNISLLGNRLGPLVLQFPYFSKKVFDNSAQFIERLDRFLEELPGEFRYGVEIRNKNWLTPDYADLLRKHNVALVLIDNPWMPHGDEIEKSFDPVTTDFVYIRLLGDRKKTEAMVAKWDREYIDQNENLARWAELVVRMLKRDVEVLAYANNHYSGYAPATADRLLEMVEKASPKNSD